jgi:DNA-binding response OmpR family regulator
VSAATRTPPSAVETTVGTETILLVEDDNQLRPLIQRTLEREGYNVLVASEPYEAIVLAAAYDQPIHLLLTDVLLPNLNGRELATRLSALRIETRLLYMSGATDAETLRQGVLASGTTFLQKPFTPGELAHRVREVLDQPR